MTEKIIMTDGTRTETLFRVKSLNPFTDETPGVWSPDPVDVAKQAKSNRLVPSVYAGLAARMQAMADMPFSIYNIKGDKEVDNSDDYQNVIGFMPNPVKYLGLSEGALTAAGSAYWFKGTGEKTGIVKELKYWIPSSVTLDPESARKGVIKFRRQGTQPLFDVKQVLYHWLYDEGVELGAPSVYPLQAALIAAEANGAITKWIRDYMQRGAIKAMLLAVEGMPPAAEVQKMENWWNRFMSGARGLAWKVFNASNVKPTVVGDGLESLKDLSVKKDLRYEIHEALGTRHLLEDENFATANARERQFYSQTIVPDARILQNDLNEQILHEVGFHWEFEPERLESFRQNEVDSAGAVQQITNAINTNPKASVIAMSIMGYKVPEATQKEILAYQDEWEKNKQEEKKFEREAMAQRNKPVNAKALVELDKWEKKVAKAKKMVTWHAVELSAEMVKAINEGALTFEDARAQLQDAPTNDAALVLEGLRLAVMDRE